MQPDDGELMQKVMEGDMRAFDVLVRRWEHQLFNLIYRIVGDFETSKDIRQEVLMRVYQAAKRYRPRSQFKAWLYRIAVNCSINELRKRERRQMLPLTMLYQNRDGEQQPLESILPDPNPGPDEVIQRNEIAECIRDALRRLPDEQRIVVVLRHYEGMKFQQIASLLNCPLGTVKSRMHHGLERLRVMLKNIRWEGEVSHGL